MMGSLGQVLLLREWVAQICRASAVLCPQSLEICVVEVVSRVGSCLQSAVCQRFLSVYHIWWQQWDSEDKGGKGEIGDV